MTNQETSIGMDGSSFKNFYRMPDGSLLPVDDNGHVHVPLIEEDIIVDHTANNSLRFELKIEGSVNSMREAQDAMGIFALNNFPSQPTIVHQPQSHIETQPHYEYTSSPSLPDEFTYNDSLEVQRRLREQEIVQQQPLSLDKQDNREWYAHTEPQTRNMPLEDTGEYEAPRKKFSYRKFGLGAFALTAVIVAGPIIQASSNGAAAAEDCGPNPICLTGHFIDDLDADNILHFIPENN